MGFNGLSLRVACHSQCGHPWLRFLTVIPAQAGIQSLGSQ
jgi:hypothetical protein